MTGKALAAVAGAVLTLTMTAPAASASPPAALRISLDHAPSHVLPGMVAAFAMLTVSNAGRGVVRGPVTVTDALPPGLTATAMAGAGWTCAGSTCSRTDSLAPHRSYPPIRLVFDVAADVPAELTNTATVTAAGRTRTTVDRIPARDACPYGWSPGALISFDGTGSGVRNPSRPDGCTLLDHIWEHEPFRDHDGFVATVARVSAEFVHMGLISRGDRDVVVRAAARSTVGTGRDPKVDNSCANRIALTFDDGVSSFRPKLLRVLRDKHVHATFFDNGVRVEANPAIAAFQAREGHLVLNHTYLHVHMDQLPAAVNTDEVLRTERVLAAAGAPIPFKGIRPPFGGSNPAVQRLLIELGYTYFLNRINAADWLPDKPATAIADEIMAQLRPGVIIGLHDGPVDTPAGAATVDAVAQIIDRARALGYCFGVVSPSGHVVADRYIPTGQSIPDITRPVPYLLPLAFGTPDRIPQPWVRIPSPLQITATHAPATFTRGQTGTLTLTVTNTTRKPTDGAPVTVIDDLPPGLTPVSTAGHGWTCTATTCTRTDILNPHRSYPPITITVSVPPNAPATLTHAPRLIAHGGSWTAETTDPIPVTG